MKTSVAAMLLSLPLVASAQDPPLPSAPDWTVVSGYDYLKLGFSVSSAGDVNDDGFDDVLIGCTGYIGRTLSRVRLYLGSATGLSPSPIWTVYGMEDLDSNWAERLGSCVVSAGDVNDDGFDDVILGADGWSGNAGRASVYLGGPGGLAATPVWSTSFGHYCGQRVVSAGDVNGDGYDDVLIGAPGWQQPGEVRLYHGTPTGPSVVHDWAYVGEAWNQLGEGLASGDYDGDGYSDIAIGGENLNKVYIFAGSPSGMPSSPTWQRNGVGYFGERLSAGDLNGDGFADLLVTSGGYQSDIAVRAFFGTPAGPSETYDWIIGYEYVTGSNPLATGDINGDGFDDVLLGDDSNSNTVKVFLGSATGPGSTPDWGYSPPDGGYRYGFSISSAGDVDGDGAEELIVGHPYWHPAREWGEAFLFGGVPSVPPDADPPLVEITTPADGTITNQGGIWVEASVTDESMTTITSTPAGLSGTLYPPGDSISGDVPLDLEGENTIVVSAVDATGNSGGDSVTVVRDSIPPGVQVSSPPNHAIVGSSPIELTAQVFDATDVTVQLGGYSVTVGSPGGSVTRLVDLVEGSNLVSVIARDQAMNETVITHEIVLDSLAPMVEIIAPGNGDCFGPGEENVQVAAIVSDLTTMNVVSTPSGIAETVAPPSGYVDGTLTLGEGANTLTVAATDVWLLEGSASITVILDTTPPEITIDSPGDGDPVRGTTDFHATVTDPNPGGSSGIQAVEFAVDGETEAVFSAGETYEVSLDTGQLSDGGHTLTVLASDNKANTREVSVTVLVDNTQPVIGITTPGDGWVVGGEIPFEVSVSDGGSGLAAVKLLAGDQPPSTDASIDYSEPLPSSDYRAALENTLRWGMDGPLVLTATTWDGAGNESAATVTVIVDNTAPEKALLFPVDGSTVMGTIEIQAVASDPHLQSIEVLVDGVSLGVFGTTAVSVPFDTAQRLDGAMVVEVIVTDQAGNAATCSAGVTVDNVSFELSPKTLNLKSKGGAHSITAWCEGASVPLMLPVTAQSVELHVPGGCPVLANPDFGALGDDNDNGIWDTMFKFDRQALISSIKAAIANGLDASAPVRIDLEVGGSLIGTALIRVKS